MSKPMILYTLVKELNISIATAVELLEKGGIVIENKPTAKLTPEAYFYIMGRFGKKPSQVVINGDSIQIVNKEKEAEEEITSLRLLKEIRKKSGIPVSVFKYFRRDDLSIRSLREGYLYHSVFSNFNDPFDCNLNLINFQKNKAHYTGTRTKFLLEFNRTGICCFTTVNDSILMWSHYASHHSGFCLEFKTNVSENGINPINVVYKKKFKTADYHTQKIDSTYHLIYSKSECWSYENELRTFIANIKNDEERLVPFDKEDLISVYLGAKCSLDYQNQIKAILTEVYSKKVNLYKAELSNNAFEIIWQPVNLLH